MGKFFLIFALIPVAEIYVLVSVGSVIGVLPTIGLVLGTALVGAYLAREQGMAIVLRIRESLAQGYMPAEEVLDGLLVFLAGMGLLAPGFLTDLLGLLILFPVTRGMFKRWLREKFDQWRQNPNVQVRFYS